MIESLPPSEMIYDAAFDDETFAHLPIALAEMLGARSTVLHWQSIGAQNRGEVVHSRYFSDEQLARLDDDFTGEDLWSNAVKATHRLNSPWLASDLVSDTAYENGRLYNDWVRAMGDDSFHGLGLAMNSIGMTGELGLHRGRTQAGFDDTDLAKLQTLVAPLRRLLDIRSRLADERGRRSDIVALLDRASDAMLIVHPNGRPIHMNNAGQALLASGDALFFHDGVIRQRHRSDAISLDVAIAAAGKGTTPKGSTMTLRGAANSIYSVTVAPAMVGDYRRVVLVVTDVNRAAASRAEQAARIFRLSRAEAEVAALLARGLSPQLIADQRMVSVLTVRSQTKTIMSKLGVRRQAEIGAAFATLPDFAPDES